MAYTAEQQERLRIAKQALDYYTSSYNGYVASYTNYGLDITTCYDGIWYDALQASTWFNPQASKCTKKGSCSNSDKNRCQALIRTLNNSIIPHLRTQYNFKNKAQENYNKILDEITKENALAEANNIQPVSDINQPSSPDTEKNNRIKSLLIILAIILVIGGGIILLIKAFRNTSTT